MTEKTKRGPAIALAAVVALATPLVMRWEGLSLTTYADPVGIPTVCYGATGAPAAASRIWTAAECRAQLSADLQAHWQRLAPCIEREVTPNQAAALLSWSYNVGTNAACGSTLTRMLNRGDPPELWCAQLSRWIYADGKRLPGLINRRAAEQRMCEGKA